MAGAMPDRRVRVALALRVKPGLEPGMRDRGQAGASVDVNGKLRTNRFAN